LSPEMITALASAGTFIVIAASAVAALVQLRHLRANNQLAALLSIHQRWTDPTLQRAATYVRYELPKRYQAPDYADSLLKNLRDVEKHPETLILEFWDQIGTLIKCRLMSEGPLLEAVKFDVLREWEAVAPALGIIRTDTPQAYENFEYLAARTIEWLQEHPAGTYPRGTRRLPIPVPAALRYPHDSQSV